MPINTLLISKYEQHLKMYTLELIHINKKENLFFQDTEIVSAEETDAYHEMVRKLHRRGIVDEHLKIQSHRLQREDGTWQSVVTMSHFKTIDSAVAYLKTYIGSGFANYRKKKSAWHIEHQIITEDNVLDSTGKIVHVALACQQDICLKFDHCPTVEQGACDLVATKTEPGKIYHIHPVGAPG